MDDEVLEAALYPVRQLRPADEDVAWADVEKDLSGRGVTLKLLWEEWRETHPNGMSYVTWTHRFRDWRPCVDVTMRQNRRPGERLFVDYAGMTITLFLDGVEHDAQVFVASMGGLGAALRRSDPQPEDRRLVQLSRALLRRYGLGAAGCGARQRQGGSEDPVTLRAGPERDLRRSA